LLSIKHCADTNNNQQYNIVRIEIKPNVCIELKNIERNFYTTSSCGICGKASIEAIKLQPQMLSNELPPTVTADTILKLPNILRQQQNVFEYTGGLHACALFTTAGKLILAREDVGRHNALDKLIGAALGSNINFNNHLMMLSGRASFELLQKAAMAGIKDSLRSRSPIKFGY
jgi:FdhD protein